jgi:hypothetical protein
MRPRAWVLWLPMARSRDTETLRRKDRVVAAEDLAGAPEGTAGRVTVVNGFRWKRYWVQFDNGTDLGSLDRTQLTLVDKRGVPVEAG